MKTLGLLTYMVLIGIFSAFVLTQLWGWFIIPLFDVPNLSIVYAMGLTVTARLIIPTSSDKKAEDYDLEDFIKVLLLPLFAWGIGWILTLFL